MQWSGCTMRPFADANVALVAGESVNVVGSSYIWKSNAASTASGFYFGQKGTSTAVTVLDAAAGASSLVASAAVAILAAATF